MQEEKMANKDLTGTDIERALPAAKAYRLADRKVPELKVRVQPTGRKLFELRYGPRQSKSIILGRHPGMTLEAARASARRTLVEISELGAPKAISARDEAQARATGQTIRTLEEFIEHRLEDHLSVHNKSGTATLARLKSTWSALMDKPMGEITADEVQLHTTARRKAGVSVATTNRDLVVLKSALSRALEWGLIDSHPLAKVKPSKDQHSGVVRYLGSEDAGEEKRLRDALAKRDAEAIEARTRTVAGGRAQHDKLTVIPADGFADHLTPMVIVAMNTGLRRGELTKLIWSDVDLERKLVTVRAGYAKSGTARHVPLNSEAVSVLQRWKKQKPTGRVFEVVSIKTAWASLMVTAKITAFRFHDLRHHFASKLVQAGVPLNTVRALLGHADLTMTLRYAHLAPRDTAAAVELLVPAHADMSNGTLPPPT
ncbi:MAG: site-specific integrase [Xanthomonadales bacterium]|nr:site-specific integrase [Xanthomonadales bacterium]